VYFTRDDTPRPCWHCRWYYGIDHIVALCAAPGCSRVKSSPERGCSKWQREPGADDVPELGPPLPAVYPVTVKAVLSRRVTSAGAQLPIKGHDVRIKSAAA
jgi:hypothetical protein